MELIPEESNEVIMSDQIQKNEFIFWHNRFLILTSHALTYRIEETDLKDKGEIELDPTTKFIIRSKY